MLIELIMVLSVGQGQRIDKACASSTANKRSASFSSLLPVSRMTFNGKVDVSRETGGFLFPALANRHALPQPIIASV